MNIGGGFVVQCGTWVSFCGVEVAETFETTQSLYGPFPIKAKVEP